MDLLVCLRKRCLRAAFGGLLAVAALAPVVVSANAADAPKPFRLASPPGGGAQFGANALTAAERQFLKDLPELRVGLARPGFRPYEVIGDDGVISGLHPEMLASLAKAFGLRVRPVVFDRWSEVMDALKRHEVDLLMSVTVTPARAEFLDFTLGVSPMVSGLFTRPGQPAAGKGARFAVLPNKAATDYVQRHFTEAQFIEMSDEAAALRALSEKQADYYLGDLLPTLDALQRLGMAGIEVQRTVEYGTGHYHFAVRKGLAPLSRILNRAIAATADQPATAWQAAVASIPDDVLPRRSRHVDPRHQAALIDYPVWRIGAVRGLSLLNEIDSRGHHVGIGAEYAEAVARTLGVGLQVQGFEDVAGMLDALRAGRIDVVPFLTRTEERAREFGYSHAYVEMPYMIVSRNDAPLYWDLASLRGRRVALALQHPVRELLARRYPQIQVVDVPSGQGAMDAVVEGRADAAIEVKFFANLRIQRDNDGVLRTVAVVDELPATFHFGTSAQARPLVPVIDDALALIPEAERDRLLRRWIAQDLVPQFPWRRYQTLIAVVALGLLLLIGGTWWWMRRLGTEVAVRRRWQALLHDVASTVPSVSFRYRLDAHGRLQDTYVSPNAQAFFGFMPRSDRTIVQSLAAGLAPEDRARVEAQERQCLVTGERFRANGRFQMPGQSPRWLHAEAVHSVDEDGRSLWTGFVADISHEHELQQKLAKEAEARHLLLASASHELRAPTHNLTLALQSIDRSAVSVPTAAALRVAESSAQTLSLLLNDVLDAARFDGALLRLRPVAFDLHALLQDLAEAWSVAARAKGLVFEQHIAPEVPKTWVHDPLRLRQVLTNLLSNACKYTDQGSITLLAHAEGAAVVFGVRDTGRGIAPADQERLFRPFETLGSEPSPAEGRSGLGLAMCQRIVGMAGGRIEVSSREGEGSQFNVCLPPGQSTLDTSAQEAAAWRAAQTVAASGSGPRVLVCDDDPVSRLLTGQILRQRGFAVLEAPDVASALSLWSGGSVAAVVTDLHLPEVSGHELIRAVREREAAHARRTVIIVCSGEEPLAAGRTRSDHDAYLQKPVQAGLLVRALAERGVVAPVLLPA